MLNYRATKLNGWMIIISISFKVFFVPTRWRKSWRLGEVQSLLWSWSSTRSSFTGLLFEHTGPPYDAFHPERMLYCICSFSGPSFSSFVIVVVTTSTLVVRCRQNLAWGNEATKQSARDSGTSKEQKAEQPVIAISTIFIVCFTSHVITLVTGLVYPSYDLRVPYLGNITKLVFVFCLLFQLGNSTVNIFVYYHKRTRYRGVFDGLFRRKTTWGLGRTEDLRSVYHLTKLTWKGW